MKNLLTLKASGVVAPSTVTALVREVSPPHPDSPDKQHVLLSDGETEMGCNIYGDHMHLSPDKGGMVMTITIPSGSKAAYLSVFDDKGRCLTLRDGVKFSFREPKPGTVVTAASRVFVMAQHYATCFQAAKLMMPDEITDEVLQPIATTLFLDSKSLVRVTANAEAPKAPAPAPKAAATPEVDEDDEVPVTTSKSPPEASPAMVSLLMKMDDTTFMTKAVAALSYLDDEHGKMVARASVISVINTGKKASWVQVFDALWSFQSDPVRTKMDAAVAQAVELSPSASQEIIHKAGCYAVRAK